MRFIYNSFGGRFSDSPRAIYETLARDGAGHEHVWLADAAHAAMFPDGVDTVELGTPASVEALESADVLIANTHTEVEWDKPPGTLYLQIWHGTPLKRIHWDVLWAPEGRLARLQRDVDRWDVLVSPNHASTRWLRQAFRFEGEVLESGYPRNDVLAAPGREAHRARVRAELGIEHGKRAVLYAPTWRDDFVFGADEDLELAFDPAALADALGTDHRLLLRVHYLLTGRLAATEHPAVLDLSAHPEISDLYLAADVLVTDYSSVMFDFAVTGKPMIFFAYDLAAYRDSLRGFYFDFEPIAPGPVVETVPELIAALIEPGDTHARYADFRDRYCHLEDGHATTRVLERLMAVRGL